MSRIRKSEEIRIRLLDQGISMFIDKGYHGTGIQEVVEKVGIPKGSFYNYFKSKEDFGSEVLKRYSENFKKFLSSIVKDSEKNAFAALERFFDDLIKMFEDKNCKEGCLLANLAAEISDRSELGRETMYKCINDWRYMLKEAIARGQEQKTVRCDITAGEIADFLLNSIEGSIIRMKIEANSDSLKQLKEIFMNFVAGKYH